MTGASLGAPATTSDDLGVRPLPLLSDDAFAAYQEGRYSAEAILEVGQRVFPDALAAFAEVAAWELSDERVTDEAVNDLGVARSVVEDAFVDNSPGEDDVLTLSAYLLLQDADRSFDLGVPPDVAVAAGVVGLALAEGAAERFGTCDARLAFAHARSLVRVSSPDAVDGLFDAAIAACGRDVTAAVAKAYYDLGFASEGEGADCLVDAATVNADSWESVLGEFRAIQESAPNNPAGYVGEGDTYRIAADVLSQWGVQPFTIRAFHTTASRAYLKARTLSAAEEITESLATVHLAQGDPDEAERLLSETASESPTAASLALGSDIAAAKGDFHKAAQFAEQSQAAEQAESSDRHSRIRELRGINAAFPPTATTGAGDASSANLLRLSTCGGGSLTHDRSYVPVFRPSEDGFTERVHLGYWVLASDWGRGGDACLEAAGQADLLACEVLAARGEADVLSDAAGDYYQNLLRAAGDLGGAAAVAESWGKTAPNSPVARERLGEIAFLQQDWGRAASESATAARLYEQDPEPIAAYSAATGAQWAQLRQGAADREAGATAATVEVLEPLAVELNAQDPTTPDYDPLIHMYVEQELGLAEYDRGDFVAAIQHLERSIDIGRSAETLGVKVVRGAQAHAASAAALQLGRADQARAFAQQALAIDPYNPLFREAVAEAQRELDPDAAIASYRSALSEDDSLFSTWNNLGVLLFQQGQPMAALTAFERAVAIRPDYATGWFNIGVVESDRPGLGHFLRSQGALGKAASVDQDFRNRDTTTVAIDEEIYDSGLDLSQPIPKDWELVETQRSRPAALGLGLILLVILRIAWALSSDWFVGRTIERAIEDEAPKLSTLRRVLKARPTAIWTTVVSLTGLLLLTGVSGVREAVLGLALFSALLAAHSLAPRFAHHGETSLRQASFLPASLFTAVLTPLGLGFTPPAPLENDDRHVSPLVRRSGVLALGLLTAALACIAWMTAVPVTRSGATAGLLLVSSALLPVSPLDGARLNLPKALELAVALAIGAATVLFAAGVI